MKKLYKIWYVHHNHDKPCESTYVKVEFDPVAKTWAYPMVEILSSFPRYSRSDVVSIDLPSLQDLCKYLNEMADEDVHYEIREDA